MVVDETRIVGHGESMKIRISLGRVVLAFILALAICLAAAHDSSQDRIPAAEFSKIIKSFSEEEGYFLSDNLVSNEDGYLSILKKLRELNISGGAYIGVGPEQNFTYIAKLRPSIAFLIDIRRQAIIQHLMYKALFHLSKNRAEFLSRLLGRRMTGKDAPGADSTLGKLMEYFSIAPADISYYTSNLAEIERIIQSEFPLSKEDRDTLANISNSFYTDGLDISFRFRSNRRGGFGMPSMRELIEQVDSDGKPGNFLAGAEDYGFVRDLHENNRIIPVVGDFAGPKTIQSIAGYLRDHSYKVSAFYTSNVEMYLFQNDSFDDFVKNVKSLPTTADSLFIRSANNRGFRRSPGYRMSTLLQYISVFLKDHQDGLYTDYWTLVNTHFIPLNP
jgi:hypothetical protein